MIRAAHSTLVSTAAPATPRLRVGKLCVAIQAGSAAAMMERAQAALADSKFLEFRLDSLAKPAAALGQLREFLAEHRDVTAIATCRRKEFGGHFVRSLTEEFATLLRAAEPA
jgi:3-dehydroquinate dehydratase/shikimate dehydrogenase